MRPYFSGYKFIYTFSKHEMFITLDEIKLRVQSYKMISHFKRFLSDGVKQRFIHYYIYYISAFCSQMTINSKCISLVKLLKRFKF